MNWLKPLSSAIDGVVGIFKSKQEQKANAEQAKAKLKQTKLQGEHEVTLTDAEGEALLAQGLESSWKDEYVTVLVTSPYALLVLGAISLAVFNDSRMLDAAVLAISNLEKAGVDLDFLFKAVVLSAIGLKVWRGK
ncbi:MAG: hypothetical protein VYA33_12435 [Pseudomonadota bacterium]|uniref:hypothetical protein n=1 Tax=Alteromonas sp. AO-Serp TaxID=2804349 RepID=UPI00257FDE5A|nr:hypothetical protein [Alteromonas sp. AO-Serp]MEC7634239.1 hypothetical protein [Pseudomonadota bacterium]